MFKETNIWRNKNKDLFRNLISCLQARRNSRYEKDHACLRIILATHPTPVEKWKPLHSRLDIAPGGSPAEKWNTLHRRLSIATGGSPAEK